AEHLKAGPWARSVPSARSCRAILRKANWKRTSNRLNPKKKTCGASMSRWAGISTLARAGPAAIATETQEERHKLPGPPRTHRFCEPSQMRFPDAKGEIHAHHRHSLRRARCTSGG